MRAQLTVAQRKIGKLSARLGQCKVALGGLDQRLHMERNVATWSRMMPWTSSIVAWHLASPSSTWIWGRSSSTRALENVPNSPSAEPRHGLQGVDRAAYRVLGIERARLPAHEALNLYCVKSL